MNASASQLRLELVSRDNEGFLLDPEDWDLELAAEIAHELGIAMTDDHWEIVHFVREFYEQNQTVPELRTVLKFLREKHGKEKATRRHVYNLFPWGFGQQACKIAGMRKPLKLMLDL